jgi:hypothetical protein
MNYQIMIMSIKIFLWYDSKVAQDKNYIVSIGNVLMIIKQFDMVIILIEYFSKPFGIRQKPA